jgi:hypothetical protein
MRGGRDESWKGVEKRRKRTRQEAGGEVKGERSRGGRRE